MLMKLKLFISACIIFQLGFGQNPKKSHSKPVRTTQKKTNVVVEIISPQELSIDSTALILLDSKVIKYYLYQDLLNKNKVEVVNAMQPKEAIQKYGELARNGAIVVNTIKK